MDRFPEFDLSVSMAALDKMTNSINRDAKAEAERRRVASDATIETAEALREMREAMESERIARIKAEKQDTVRFWINFSVTVIAAIAAIAAVIVPIVLAGLAHTK